MNSLIRSVLILTALILTVFLYLQFSGQIKSILNHSELDSAESEEFDDDENEEKILIVEGYKAIQLEEEIIYSSGIEYAPLHEITIKSESIIYPEVVDTSSLVAFKTEYENLLSEKKILQNDLYNHETILKRAIALNQANSLSARDLEKAQANRDIKASRLNAIKTKLENYVYQLKARQGAVLASLITSPERENEFNELAMNKSALILVSLKSTQTLKDINQKVYINNVNQRDTALETRYLDRAMHVSNPLFGESHYYLSATDKFRSGMRLFGWLEDQRELLAGQFISDDAVIWYANTPWIYIKHTDDIFVRKPLTGAKKIHQGWLLADKTLVGEAPVVISGGQTILSEEFKWAIPDEDDD